MADVERLTISSAGNTLEAELARPGGAPRIGVVLCHPHPQYGGTMRSIVIGALFAALPSLGATVLRFNFRGVEASTGTYDEGRGERDDARAAVQSLAATLAPATPLVLVGWSFGADMALSVLDPAVSAWVAIAPPLHFVADVGALAADPRRKLLTLAAHDEIRSPDEVITETSTWLATDIEVIPGASHFFVGRTDRLTEVVSTFVASFIGSGDSQP
ncbi:MAG: alpha/beta hydrolase [Acidimicrobiia bacterium]|nr:alpha/beta hydrolase [Acidimicrobiia bacterium]